MVLYRLENSDALLLIAGETFPRLSADSVPQLDLQSECCPPSLSSALTKSVSHVLMHRSSQLWAFGCLTALVLLSGLSPLGGNSLGLNLEGRIWGMQALAADSGFILLHWLPIALLARTDRLFTEEQGEII